MLEKLRYIFNELTKKFIINFFGVFGAFWLVIEFLSFLFVLFRDFITDHAALTLLSVIIFSAILTIKINLPKTKIKRNFRASNTSICIKVGDLLEEKGNIAIGVSDYFDTVINDPQSNSLKRQIIKKLFDENLDLVDEQITQSLKKQKIKGTNNPSKKYGKTKKYKIGTIATLKQNNQKVFFLVLAQLIFDKKNRKFTEVDISNFNKAISKLWNELYSNGNNKEISIPILGSGLSRMSISRLILIQTIIISFVGFARSKKITKQLNIIINKSNYSAIEFSEIQKFLNSLSF